MKESVGSKSFPIWLLGDSPPDRWKADLDYPLDSRHPIRHNIWSSVLVEIQKNLYSSQKLRLDEDSIYIRNAISDVAHRPIRNHLDWPSKANSDIVKFQKLIEQNKQRVLITFGAMSFEFARRSLRKEPQHKYGYWNTLKHGDEFRKAVAAFDPNIINVFPLLHRSIAGGYFLKGHENYTGDVRGNYYEYVGRELAYIIHKFSNHSKNVFL